MRFVGASRSMRDRLTGHVLRRGAARRIRSSPRSSPSAYGSGLYRPPPLDRMLPSQLDDAFAAFIREAAERVGRRERLSDADG